MARVLRIKCKMSYIILPLVETREELYLKMSMIGIFSFRFFSGSNLFLITFNLFKIEINGNILLIHNCMNMLMTK